MTIKLNDFGGGGSLLELAPDLTYPTKTRTQTYRQVLGIDTTSGLTEMLGLTGKFAVSLLTLTQLTSSDPMVVKLTVDGIVIWNDTNSGSGTNMALLGGEIAGSSATGIFGAAETILVKNSLSLEVNTTSDSSINLEYAVRAII